MSNDHATLTLFNWSLQRSEVVDARAWFTVLAVRNPTAVSFKLSCASIPRAHLMPQTDPLLGLINLESSLSNFSHVESLFESALKGPSGGVTTVADVSIWKAYLHYVRQQNPLTDGQPNEQTRQTITKGYEFALEQCGTDREAAEIWQEYIAFVQGNKVCWARRTVTCC